MRFYHIMEHTSLAKEPLKKRRNAWILNATITGAVVVGMMGLARVSATTAWWIAVTGLIALVIFFYVAGRSER